MTKHTPIIHQDGGHRSQSVSSRASLSTFYTSSSSCSTDSTGPSGYTWWDDTNFRDSNSSMMGTVSVVMANTLTHPADNYMANFKDRSHANGKEVRVINYHQRNNDESEPTPDYSDASPRKKAHHEPSR